MSTELRRIGKELQNWLDSALCCDRTVIAIEIEYRERSRVTWRKVWRRDDSDRSLSDFVTLDLDQTYDAGYGTQHVDGTVWFDDKTWLERRDNDGSEWWEFYECPPLPNKMAD